MKFNKFVYLYSKPLGNDTIKIMKKIPGNLLKNLEKSWKYYGILSVRKSGNPAQHFLYSRLIYHLLLQLLQYASTTLLFSDRKIDDNVITWNRVVLLHGK